MRLILLGLLVLITTEVYSQSSPDFGSTQEIDSLLIGTWKLKDSDNDSRFVFSTDNGVLKCKVYQYVEENETISNIIHDTEVTVKETETGFEVQWDEPLFYWKGRIEKLKTRHLLVEINGNQLKFVKSKS